MTSSKGPLRPNRTACGAMLFFTLVTSLRAEPETAASADSFVDSIGVCSHTNTVSGRYAAATNDQVDALLGELGVRYIRTDIHGSSLFPSRIDRLYRDYGIRSDLIANRKGEEIPLEKQIEIVKNDPAVESVEGANEPDNGKAAYTYVDLRGEPHQDNASLQQYDATAALQRDIASLLRGAKPLLSPAMAHAAATPFFGPVPCDVAACHPYPGGGQPGNANLDGGLLPPLDVAFPRTAGTAIPIQATESGYNTAPQYAGRSNPAVTEAAFAKYLPRLYAESFNRGIARTYSYDIIDDGTDLADKECNFGLVRYDFTRKAAFEAEKNLIALLSEAKWDKAARKWVGIPSFSPDALDYRLSGVPPTVHHTLLQKSDGTFYLLLWQEVVSCDISKTPRVDIERRPVPVTLELTTPIAKAEIFRPSKSSQPEETIDAPSSIPLEIPDEILVLRLQPAASRSLPAVSGTEISLRATAGNAPADVLGRRFFAASRTGPLESSIEVPYTLRNASGETLFSGKAVFPAGVATVHLPGPIPDAAFLAPGATVEGALQEGEGYRLAAHAVDRVSFPARRVIAGLERANPSAWTCQSQVEVGLEEKSGDGGGGLKWTYHNTDPEKIPFQAEIRCTLPSPQDWRGHQRIVFRFAADPKNPIGDFGHLLFFTFYNGKTRVAGSSAVDTFFPDASSGYRTVELDLGDFPRDQVTTIVFFATGGRWSRGDHVWYLDAISLQ